MLLTVFDERRNASYLAMLDAMHIEAGPVAKAYLDHRVPVGFHGLWLASPNVTIQFSRAAPVD